jgi:hypothetical protein
VWWQWFGVVVAAVVLLLSLRLPLLPQAVVVAVVATAVPLLAKLGGLAPPFQALCHLSRPQGQLLKYIHFKASPFHRLRAAFLGLAT